MWVEKREELAIEGSSITMQLNSIQIEQRQEFKYPRIHNTGKEGYAIS